VVVTVDIRVNVVMPGRVVLWECNRTGGHDQKFDAGQSKKGDWFSRDDIDGGDNDDRKSDDGRTYCLWNTLVVYVATVSLITN